MIKLQILTVLILFTLHACAQKAPQNKVDPEAVKLNYEAANLVLFIDDPDSAKKAISLLDKATEIDNNYFLGHFNKLMFYYQLNELDKAAKTYDKLIQLQPSAHDLYLSAGILQEKMGKSNSAKTFFEKSLSLCNNILDTMNKKHRDYSMITTNKGVNLILLGDVNSGNKILKDLYEKLPDDPTYDNVEKKYIFSLMNKSRSELIELITNPQSYSH